MTFIYKKILFAAIAFIFPLFLYAVYTPVELLKPVEKPTLTKIAPTIEDPISPENRGGKIVANREVIEGARVKLVDGKLPELPKDGIPRIDASSSDSLQQSFFDALMSVDSTTQDAFSTAWITLGVLMSDPSIGNAKIFGEVVHGKTADELIAFARRLSPVAKSDKIILDGRDAAAFGKSVANALVSLSGDKRADFSEALAKIIYDLGEDKKSELFKMLDGKNPDEVIALAKNIRTPYDVMRRQNLAQGGIELTPVEDVPEWAKAAVRDDDDSLSESLAPSAIVPEAEK